MTTKFFWAVEDGKLVCYRRTGEWFPFCSFKFEKIEKEVNDEE